MASKVVKNKPASTGKPKPPAAGRGRPKGSQNKATAKAKEAIAMLADGMTHELQGWLRTSAYGVAELWELWQPQEEGEEPPPDAVTRGRGKSAQVLRRMRGKDGKVLTASLADIMSGSLPEGAIVQWVLRPDPGGATDTMLRALEYHIPKLARTEHTGPNGGKLEPAIINITGVKAPRREE